MMVYNMTVVENRQTVNLSAEQNKRQFDLTSAERINVVYPIYDGITVVTPTREEQILLTQNKTVLENIVINPIPNNYGLVEYNGSYLRVS